MITEVVMPIAYKLSPRLCFSLQYFHNRHRFPNLSNPKNFSEVIGYQIVRGEIDQYYELVDKIKVRNYLAKWGFADYLPKVYKVWDNANDIDLTGLPERFIIKTNHGSGGHIICKNVNMLNVNDIKEHFDKMLHVVYNPWETQYAKIQPLVYCEEFIEDGHTIPTDFKYMCLDGEIKAILLCFDRDSNVHKLVYDENWNKLPYVKEKAFVGMNYPKPKNLEEMNKIAKQIASRFVQVRVDLYNAFGKIYIGELTFTADGGILRTFTDKAIKEMGRK